MTEIFLAIGGFIYLLFSLLGVTLGFSLMVWIIVDESTDKDPDKIALVVGGVLLVVGMMMFIGLFNLIMGEVFYG